MWRCRLPAQQNMFAMPASSPDNLQGSVWRPFADTYVAAPCRTTTAVWTCGVLGCSAMSFCLAAHPSRQRGIQTHTGRLCFKLLPGFLRACLLCHDCLSGCLCITLCSGCDLKVAASAMTVPGCRRILKVDLVFPGQFKVSAGAKDLIAKVCTAKMSHAHMLALSLRRPCPKR